jgi:hypothetical protein
LDNENTDELGEIDDENLGAVGGPLPTDTDKGAVAAQLAILTSY